MSAAATLGSHWRPSAGVWRPRGGGCGARTTQKPVGLVWLIDEESNFPKATDKSLLEKLSSNHSKHAYYVKPKLSDRSFAIKHYAGTVTYTISNFLDKNRDSLRQELMDTLASSRKPFIVQLFKAEGIEDTKETTMSRGAGGRRAGSKIPTVVSQFHQSLTDLIATLEQCNPYFVRCIKPNSSKASRLFEGDLVLAQLRYSGMLETIRIRRAGYPVRFAYKEFHGRFRILMLNSDHNNLRRGCQQILDRWPFARAVPCTLGRRTNSLTRAGAAGRVGYVGAVRCGQCCGRASAQGRLPDGQQQGVYAQQRGKHPGRSSAKEDCPLCRCAAKALPRRTCTLALQAGAQVHGAPGVVCAGRGPGDAPHVSKGEEERERASARAGAGV